MQVTPNINRFRVGVLLVVAAVSVMTFSGGAKTMNAEYYSLFNFTELHLKWAREMARSGRKDEARNWCRYFGNSGIITHLERHSGASRTEIDALKSGLSALNDECHPATRCDQKTEMAEIRIRLDGLAFGISKLMERDR